MRGPSSLLCRFFVSPFCERDLSSHALRFPPKGETSLRVPPSFVTLTLTDEDKRPVSWQVHALTCWVLGWSRKTGRNGWKRRCKKAMDPASILAQAHMRGGAPPMMLPAVCINVQMISSSGSGESSLTVIRLAVTGSQNIGS